MKLFKGRPTRVKTHEGLVQANLILRSGKPVTIFLGVHCATHIRTPAAQLGASKQSFVIEFAALFSADFAHFGTQAAQIFRAFTLHTDQVSSGCT
jgi:hypothetical protein